LVDGIYLDLYFIMLCCAFVFTFVMSLYVCVVTRPMYQFGSLSFSFTVLTFHTKYPHVFMYLCCHSCSYVCTVCMYVCLLYLLCLFLCHARPYMCSVCHNVCVVCVVCHVYLFPAPNIDKPTLYIFCIDVCLDLLVTLASIFCICKTQWKTAYR
jgi:hypothetical protein